MMRSYTFPRHLTLVTIENAKSSLIFFKFCLYFVFTVEFFLKTVLISSYVEWYINLFEF